MARRRSYAANAATERTRITMGKQHLLKPYPSYKANLHCHSTFSDGRLTPEDLKTAYMAEGYSILAYTDHRHYGWYKDLTDENFLALAAYEVDMNEWADRPNGFDRVKTYHLNLYDTKPETGKTAILPERRYGDIHYLNQYIESMRQAGYLVCYNHPYWSLQNYDDYKDLRGCFAMEIYNHGCEHDGLYGYNPQSYDAHRQSSVLCCNRRQPQRQTLWRPALRFFRRIRDDSGAGTVLRRGNARAGSRRFLLLYGT